MKAEELRVGNYITDHTGVNNIVKAIGVGWVKFIDDEACAFDLAKGISFTPEVLQAVGFTNEIEEDLPEGADFLCFFKDNIDVELQPGLLQPYEVVGVTLYEDAVDDEGELIAEGKYEIKSEIKYLHQLQNLYYSLMGEELKIEL